MNTLIIYISNVNKLATVNGGERAPVDRLNGIDIHNVFALINRFDNIEIRKECKKNDAPKVLVVYDNPEHDTYVRPAIARGIKEIENQYARFFVVHHRNQHHAINKAITDALPD